MERPRVHFVFRLHMRQLSPLTHRTSIRFCTQSCGRIKRKGGAPRGYSLRDVSIGIADRSPTSSSTYCLPDPRAAGYSQRLLRPEFIASHACASHLLLLTFVVRLPSVARGILSELTRRHWTEVPRLDTIKLSVGELKSQVKYLGCTVCK